MRCWKAARLRARLFSKASDHSVTAYCSNEQRRQSGGLISINTLLGTRIKLAAFATLEEVSMKVLVRESAKSQGQWQVRLDQHVVSFRNETEARAFVRTLESRLLAPHTLPTARQYVAG
jgi:hypothetical protein